MRAVPEVPGVEHRFVEANGIRIHLAEAGSGKPLVLLHGWPQHWYEWRHLIGPLAERHRVLCPDLRGFGWTDAPPGGYDPEVFATDIIALLDALEIDEPVALAGHDWGGLTGFILCLRHPERFSRFLALNVLHVFTAPSLRTAGTLWRFWYQLVNAAPILGPRVLSHSPGYRNPVLRWIGVHPGAWTEEELAIFTDQFAEPARARATASLYRHLLIRFGPAIARGRYREMRLRTPTLMLFGMADKPLSHKALSGYEPYADAMRVELVPDTGHFIVDERPELVLERASEIFAEA
jgi:pimeloyl-ACP methyl ester carboxylesterase